MIYTNFNGKLISKLGAGTLRLPTRNGSIDIEETSKIIDYLMESGVTYYDLGHSYFAGKAEEAIRRALVMRYPRERYYLSNKLHVKDVADSAKILFENQLKACGVSYFDFYLVHGITEELWENIEEKMIFSLLREKKEEAKIGAVGASFHTGFGLFEYILNKYDGIIEFVQLPLNYLDMSRTDVKKQYELARERNIPIIAMSPLKGGLLSCGENEKIELLFSKLREKYSASYYDLGLLYAASLDGLMCVLSGISDSSQAEHNAALLEKEIKLAQGEMEQLEIAAQSLSLGDDIRIPCLGCNYCDKCPSQIKIARIFELYNELSAREYDESLSELKRLVAREKLAPYQCLRCGRCEDVCPEGLNIISFIERLGYTENE